MVTDNNNSKVNYFLPGPQQHANIQASKEIIQQLCQHVPRDIHGY